MKISLIFARWLRRTNNRTPIFIDPQLGPTKPWLLPLRQIQFYRGYAIQAKRSETVKQKRAAEQKPEVTPIYNTFLEKSIKFDQRIESQKNFKGLFPDGHGQTETFNDLFGFLDGFIGRRL